MTSPLRLVRLSVLAALAATAMLGSPVSPAAAPAARAQSGDYSLETVVMYRLDPGAGRIDVSIDAVFTNTAPDPPGGYTIFDEALLALHPGASELRAGDAEGSLAVAAAPEEETLVATVTLRAPIRHREVATFRLSYALLDGATPEIRIRGPGSVFTAWAFGTRSRVTVELPAEYEVEVQGDELRQEAAGEVTRLTSGEIESPGSWAAVITAARPGRFVTLRAAVALESATADLRVAAWSDDEEWGHQTLALLVDALPVLERFIGLPYEHTGPLTVRESVSRSETVLDASAGSGAEILLGFDQPPFTALHEAAHIWFGPPDIRSRWIYEGFASYYADLAAAELEIEPPYDPIAVRADNVALAFPLDEWAPLGESTDERDRYGYPASWAVATEIARRAGDDVLAEVLARVAARRPAYVPADDAAAASLPPAGRLDGRALLDHLEEVGGVAFDDLFERYVFPADDVALLEARRRARSAYRQLDATAGGWGAPLPVVEAMNRWDFEAAVDEMARATEWLRERDRLVAELRAAGLEPPERLRRRYVTDGGGAASHQELAAERSLLDAYRDARDEFARPATPLEQIGLFPLAGPGDQLDDAERFFESGDIEAASAGIAAARDAAASAEVMGALRLATALILVSLAAAVVRREFVGPSPGSRPAGE